MRIVRLMRTLPPAPADGSFKELRASLGRSSCMLRSLLKPDPFNTTQLQTIPNRRR
jgi:hypothetical protein